MLAFWQHLKSLKLVLCYVCVFFFFLLLWYSLSCIQFAGESDWSLMIFLLQDGSLWSSESTGTSSGLNEVISVWNKLLVLQLKAAKDLDVSCRSAPGVQPAAPGQRSPVVPAARPAAQPAAASASITALPADVRPESLPADVPLPAPEPHRPPAHHLPLRRRGAASVPGALHSAAEGPWTADGAEPRVGSPSAQQNSVWLPRPGPLPLLPAGQVTAAVIHQRGELAWNQSFQIYCQENCF